MATSSSKYVRDRFSIVAGLKFSDAGAYAFEEAVRIGQRIPKSVLHLVHVMGGSPTTPEKRDLAGHLRLYAMEKAESLGGLHGLTIATHVRAGRVVDEIARVAHEVNADLVLVGSESGLHLFKPAVVETLTDAVTCPVVIAGPKPHALAAPEPTVEPPCAECINVRFGSKGMAWWCSQHAHTHAHGNASVKAHTYSYRRELPLSNADGQVNLTGVDR